jgi:hypothetical protein
MATILSGSTNQSLYLNIRDTSGEPLTGLAYDTAGLTAYYAYDGFDVTRLTLVQLSSNTDAWVDSGFVEVDATNMPGVYRLDIPNAAITALKNRAVVTLSGATNMQRCTEVIDLQQIDAVLTPVLGLSIAQQLRNLDIDGTWTLADYLFIMGGVLAGKISGAEGTTVIIRDLLDEIDMMHVTVDENGNRTNVTLFP